MAEQEKIQRSTTDKSIDETNVAEAESTDTTELTEALDDLLDEIDSVLEENAEEFVRNYVQKGGE
jgi:prokaryotic ubiquitin-like protein Pup